MTHAISPEYKTPPLVEVALSVEFSPIENFGAVWMARLAQNWSDEFPIVEELPPLPVSAPVGANFPGSGGMFVNVGAPQIRLWLLTTAKDRLVQVQRDRLILNWRADQSLDPYPRYWATLRPQFQSLYEGFIGFLSTNKLPTVRPFAVEAAYVNKVSQNSDQAADLSDTLRSQLSATIGMGTPTMTRLNQMWQEVRDDGQTSTLSLTADTSGLGGEAIVMTLNSRASTQPDVTVFEAMELLDLCHNQVVFSFDQLIVDGRKREWGRL